MTLKGRFTTSLMAGAAAFTVTAGAGVAQAHTTNLRSTIRSQDKAVLESAAVKRILATGQVTKAELPTVIREFQTLQTKLAHAATVVAAAPAPTATTRTGRADWVDGKRTAARAIGEYVIAFKDLEAGHKAAAQTEGKRAVQTILAADKLIVKADKTLGLPVGT